MVYANILSPSKQLCKSVKNRSFHPWTQKKLQEVEGTCLAHHRNGWFRVSKWSGANWKQYQGTRDKAKNNTSWQNRMRQVSEAPSWVFVAYVLWATSTQQLLTNQGGILSLRQWQCSLLTGAPARSHIGHNDALCELTTLSFHTSRSQGTLNSDMLKNSLSYDEVTESVL